MTYLDHAATTSMSPVAIAAMLDAANELGNPSSLHASGRRARRVVEESRELVAAALGVRPSEVIFTGGGTEADNLALKGVYWHRRNGFPDRNRVLVSAIEHHAVLDAAEWLAEHEAARLEFVPVDQLGRIDVEALRTTIEADPESVALVSCMWANNEVGTVQPVAELLAVCAEHGVPFHSDAVQAVGQLPVSGVGLSAVTVSGHKLGGPMGIGALLAGREVGIVPLQHGGGQERKVRSGTLPVPLIANFAAAVSDSVATIDERAASFRTMRDELITAVRGAVPSAILNGDPVDRLPNNAHFSFPGCEGDALLLLLDANGIECSTGSACTAGVPQPSHVLLAMGVSEELARGSLRFSVGVGTAMSDIDALVAVLPDVVERARAAGLSRSVGR